MGSHVNIGSIGHVDTSPFSDRMHAFQDKLKKKDMLLREVRESEKTRQMLSNVHAAAAKGFPADHDIEQPGEVVVTRPVAVTFKP